jgi:predicted RNA-binding Zn-ribbon protein involved in translation (DUF1610 family)
MSKPFGTTGESEHAMEVVAVNPGPPVVSAPVMSKAPPQGRKFPCSSCGAKLDFDPSAQTLKCPFCGHAEEIAPAKHGVMERDYAAYLKKLGSQRGVLPGRSSQVQCSSCGAVVLLEDKVATEKCPFCGAHLENRPEAAEAMIAPESILPFAVSDRQALQAFDHWLASRWFAPTELRQLANLGQFAGVYLPFWTYDSMTYTHYTGQRGEDYQETETYTETESFTETQTAADGTMQTVMSTRPVTKTRTVTKTRWYHVAGQVQHFFDDVLVVGSKSLTHEEGAKLSPWDLKELEEFKPEFLSGFKTERYAIGLEEGFASARAIMDQEIRQMCMQDIGGNHQRLETVRTQHVGVTFKHLLLPVWLGAYRYRDQPFRVLVNARTGKVFGRRPYSTAKIALLIITIVLLIILLFATVMLLGGTARGASFELRAKECSPNTETPHPFSRWPVQSRTPPVARPGHPEAACLYPPWPPSGCPGRYSCSPSARAARYSPSPG